MPHIILKFYGIGGSCIYSRHCWVSGKSIVQIVGFKVFYPPFLANSWNI